jgi:vesicle-fusing ATPase
MVTALIEGSVGAGKTALAAKIALEANFPCVRLITPQALVHHGEAGKCQAIVKAFEEAHKSTSAVIVVDEIERLLDYNPIGPRFSNPVCQTLLVQLRQLPPKGRRCLVLATTSKKDVLEQMGLLGCFDKIIHTPCLRSGDDVIEALKGLEGNVSPSQLDTIHRNISNRKLIVPIKRLIHFAGVAETTSPPEKFGEKIIQLLEEDNFLSDDRY